MGSNVSGDMLDVSGRAFNMSANDRAFATLGTVGGCKDDISSSIVRGGEGVGGEGSRVEGSDGRWRRQKLPLCVVEGLPLPLSGPCEGWNIQTCE